MSFIIAVLLWIGAIQAGTYTQQDFDQISSSHQSEINAIQADPILSSTVINESNPSVVTVIIPEGNE